MLAMALCLLAAALLRWGWPPGMKWDWSAVAALGSLAAAGATAAAVIVALRVASREMIWREAERKRRTLEDSAYAVEIVIPMSEQLPKFSEVHETLTGWDPNDDEKRDQACTAIASLKQSISCFDRTKITWASQLASSKLSRVTYELARIEYVVNRTVKPQQVPQVRKALTRHLDTAKASLTVAYDELLRLVDEDLR